MAHIVLTSFGSYGDLLPFIGLALELRRRGHEPVLALAPAYRALVEQAGIGFHPVLPDIDLGDRELAHRIMDAKTGSEAIYRELLIPNLERSYADLKLAADGADLLVTHPASLAGPILAEERGMPWASTILAPMSFFSLYDPIVPAPAPWLHALTSRSITLSRLFLKETDRITRMWTEPVRRFRRSRGLPEGRNPILAGQHSPYLVLGLFSQCLARPQADWPQHVTVTGAVLYNGIKIGTNGGTITGIKDAIKEDTDPHSLSPTLQEFLNSGEPPLVFTLGTSAVGRAGSFYRIAADVSRRLRRRAVLLVGRHPENRIGDGDGAGEGDTDILMEEFVSHAAIFPRAAAIIHQGGAGTLHQALAAGKPMLIVPHAHDQPDNAYRAAKLGVSRTLYPQHFTSRRVEKALRHLLEDQRYTRRAREVARQVQAESGAFAASDALEGLLSGTGHILFKGEAHG